MKQNESFRVNKITKIFTINISFRRKLVLLLILYITLQIQLSLSILHSKIFNPNHN